MSIKFSSLKTVEQRFWSYVEKRGPNECWEYKGYLRGGYGTFRVPGFTTKIGAHQASFLLSHEYLPPVVRHSCDNPPCCNPAHLLPGTHKDNVQDMVDRGRSTRGERNSHAKLTAPEVLEIRANKTSTNIQLAKEYEVTHSMISSIRLGKSWKHII